jgi:UDP-2,3-diacylglucosamine pyrophosphatase LpxH
MEKLDKLFRETPGVDIAPDDRIVIFSDLHMGNGGKMDDFFHNGRLFQSILEQYYEKEDYKIVLNGDIEELHRFSLRAVTSRWKDIYKALIRFHHRRKSWGRCVSVPGKAGVVQGVEIPCG